MCKQIVKKFIIFFFMFIYGLPAAAQSTPQSLVYGMSVESLGMLNPLLASSTVDVNYTSIIFPSLMRISADNKLQPYFAERSELSEDARVFTYHLRQNARWMDGKPVTAEDVAFTFQTMCSAGYTGTAANEALFLEGASEFREGLAERVKGIVVKDSYTIELHLRQPYAPAYARLSTIGIVPKHIWKDIPIADWSKQTAKIQKPMGFGPYQVEKYSHGQDIIFTANADFFAGSPHIQRLIFKQVNVHTMLTEFKNRTIDIAAVSHLRNNEIEEMTTSLGLKKETFMNDNYRYLSFNLRKPIFQDKELRSAMMHAIDRDVIVTKVFENRGKITNSPIFIDSWAYSQGETSPYVFDLEQAKKVLDAAGYKDSDGDGIRETPDGKKLTFTFKYQTGITPIEQMVLGIQHNFKMIGIEITLIPLPYDQLFNQAIYQHDFDLYTHDCVTRIDPDTTTWWHSSSAVDTPGKASWNFGAYKNPVVDQLLEEANTTLDQNKRKELYRQMTHILNQDIPMVFLFVQQTLIMHNPKLQNYHPSTFNLFYDIHRWQFAP